MALALLPVTLKLTLRPQPGWVTVDDGFRLAMYSCRKSPSSIVVIAEWFVPWDSTFAERGSDSLSYWLLGVEGEDALRCSDCGEWMTRIDKGRL